MLSGIFNKVNRLMPKTKPFSIYLLKPGFDHTNALKEEHKLEEAEAAYIPENAKLYILDTPSNPPWWRAYFGVERELFQSSKGALIFIEVGDRSFAISFGHVYHHLNDYSYEYDFGLRVTLNSLDPGELKSADMVSPGTARRKRTQVAISTDLTFLDFDGNSEIIKSLTGKVKDDLKELFKNATGSTSLKVGMQVAPTELPAICEQLLELYQCNDYRETFPNIQNISPIKDPTKVDELNSALLSAFTERDADLVLAIPDVVDYRDTKTCCFFRASGNTSSIFPDITIEELWEFLETNDVQAGTVQELRSFQLALCDVEGVQGKTYSVMRSLVFEVEDEDDGAIYHLTDGNWYRAEASFVQRMSDYINSRCEPATVPPYNHDAVVNDKSVYSEENYNRAVGNLGVSNICLDQKDISPSGSTQVEPCDVLRILDIGQASSKAEFLHIKISTRSSHLSHLFNQGLNAIELLELEEQSMAKLKDLIAEVSPEEHHQRFIEPLDKRNFKVVFGIITHKPAGAEAANLPLFSRLSLMRALQQLELYKIECALVFIDDQSPKKIGHAKYHTIDVHVFSKDDGKTCVRALPGQDGFDPEIEISHCPKEIRESLPGSQYKLQVSLKPDGKIRSHHTWEFDVIED